MEQQLLFLLDFEFRFDEATAIEEWLEFLPPRSSSPRQDKATRRLAINKLKAVRAQSFDDQMPPTPPHDVVPPSLSRSSTSSSSEMLLVPGAGAGENTDAQKFLQHRSPAPSNGSPHSDETGTDSSSSTGSMTDYCSGSSCTDSDVEDEASKAAPGCFPLARQSSTQETLASSESGSSSSGSRLPRVSFSLPLRPAPARSTTGRSSSVQFPSIQHRRSYQSDSGAGPTIRTSDTMSSIPRMRESVSSNFISRMFGVGGRGDRLDRAERGTTVLPVDPARWYETRPAYPSIFKENTRAVNAPHANYGGFRFAL